MVTSLPRQVGSYTLLHSLTDAADTTEVFLAKTEVLGYAELYAVKLPDEAGAERARRALTINHASLVTVLDVGSEAGQSFFAMDYIEGRSLASILARCRDLSVALPIEAGLYIGIQICRALTELGARSGWRHNRRALLPHNILLSFDGEVRLGLAGPRSLQSAHSAELAYLSPDEANPADIDPRADLYGLGVLLWELFVGRPLRRTVPPTARDFLRNASKSPIRPSATNPEVEADLDAIALRALDPDRDQRFPSPEGLREELATALVSRHAGFGPAGIAELLSRLFGDEIHQARAQRRRLLFGATEEHSNLAIGPTPDSLAGKVLGRRYRIVERIGEGGMGTVYAAEHVDIGRRVAIKILHAAYSNDPELVKRFRQEARAAAAIGHPNIVEVTDFGTTEDGRIYFVMEHLEGRDLAQVMSETRRLPIERSVDITLQICQALHSAHEAGIVHRDLKPENIFLVTREGRGDFVKLLDFGVAINIETVRRGGSRLTTPGMAMGTPEYMAPEQATGQSIDRRIDVYATSVMLFEMLTGRLPHEGSTLVALLNKKATEPPTPPSRYRDDIPPALTDTIMHGLQVDAGLRYQTMQQLAQAIVAAIRTTTGPHPQSPEDTTDGLSDATGAPMAAPMEKRLADPARPDAFPSLSAGGKLKAPANPRPSAWVWLTTLLLVATLGGLALAWHMGSFAPLGKGTGTLPADAGAPSPDSRRPKARLPKRTKPVRVPAKPAVPKAPRKLTPEEVQLHLEWARRAAAGGRFLRPKGDNARDLLRRIDTDFPNHPGVLAFRKKFCRDQSRLARRMLRRRRQAQAERAYYFCIVLNPEGAERQRLALASLRLADARRDFRKRRHNQAIRGAHLALKAMPTSVGAYELLGDIAFSKRLYKQAVEHYQEALVQKMHRRRARKLKQKLRKAQRRASK